MSPHENILQTIGKTPLVKLNRVCAGLNATILAKLEGRNPMGSVKDRIALSMVEAKERTGKLKPGMTVVAATSGNTGIGLAMVCAAKGYRLIITMPETMSIERTRILRRMGAEVVLTPGAEGMHGAVKRADEIHKAMTESVLIDQFRDPANVEVHSRTTATEILEDTGGKVNIFVAGVGTGGTITGVGRVLKQSRKDVWVVGVEPDESPVISGGKPGQHLILGIGPGFVPEILDRSVIDEVIRVKSSDAMKMALRLGREEGIFCGISSGAACVAAVEVGKREENAGKTIVTVFADTGERYLTMEWVGE
ncbi:MAG: cysteine synthase A [Thermoplasmata archaeon]|nr:cysteine synthase A [Thermoplasmata archaeon]